MPGLAELAANKDFQGLPLVEKDKVLRAKFPDYAGLPPQEQRKVLERIGAPKTQFEKERPGKGISLEGAGTAAWETAKKIPGALAGALDPTTGVTGALLSAQPLPGGRTMNPRSWWSGEQPEAVRSH